jgi:hypothetical protein
MTRSTIFEIFPAKQELIISSAGSLVAANYCLPRLRFHNLVRGTKDKFRLPERLPFYDKENSGGSWKRIAIAEGYKSDIPKCGIATKFPFVVYRLRPQPTSTGNILSLNSDLDVTESTANTLVRRCKRLARIILITLKLKLTKYIGPVFTMRSPEHDPLIHLPRVIY